MMCFYVAVSYGYVIKGGCEVVELVSMKLRVLLQL